jgi:hypothetical protein
MVEQIKFDFKKNVWSSTNLVIFAAFLILLLGTFFTALGSGDTAVSDVSRAYGNASTSIATELKALNKDKHPSAATRRLIKAKTTQEKYISAITMADAGFHSPVPIGTLADVNKAILAYAQYNLRQTEAGHASDITLIKYPGKKNDLTLLGRQKDVLFYKYLLKHDVVEIPAGKNNAPAAAYLPYQFLYHLSPLIILAVFIVQLGQLFTNEKRDGTISFMNNLPTGKLKLLTARMVTFLLLTVPSFAAACGAAYVVVGVKYGFGSWQYPLVYSADGKTPALMTLGHFFSTLCILMLAAVVLLMMVSALTSLFSGNFGVNVVVCGLVLLIGTKQVLGTGALRGVARLLPSGYFDFSNVILHQTSWPILGIGGGLTVLLLWSVLLYGVCALILRWREQL